MTSQSPSKAPALANVEKPAFTARAERLEDTLTVSYSGAGDFAAVEELGRFLQQLHTEAQRLKLTQVSCDFRRLTFMNSSCFKAFVVWIDGVKNAPVPYKIRFVTDPSMNWQRRSLEALRRLATDVVSIVEAE